MIKYFFFIILIFTTGCGTTGHAVSLEKDEVKTLIAEHNRVRADVGVGPVGWSNKIADYSMAWAGNLAKSGCKMEHRPSSGKWKQIYGENIFMGTAGYYGMAHAVQAWESEKKDYTYGPVDEKTWYPTGHYTQVVWKNTKTIGCGKSICNGNIIVVCNYDPPGNYLGEKPY